MLPLKNQDSSQLPIYVQLNTVVVPCGSSNNRRVIMIIIIF